MAKVIFGDQEFPVPAHISTVAEVKQLCGTMVAGLSEADGRIDENGDFVFEKRNEDKS